MSEHWSQPDFYHFNQDSLQLVSWVASQDYQSKSILDLGCGCGIIGIELARRLSPLSLTLLELQAEFLPHIQTNLRAFLPSAVDVVVENTSFKNFRPLQRFDLMVCNPPYYLPGHGQASENIHRSLCRSFEVDGWGALLALANGMLEPRGRLVVIIPQDKVLLQHVRSAVAETELSMQCHSLEKMLVVEFTVA